VSNQVEEQVRLSLEAIRAAQAQPDGFDLRALTDLTQRVQRSATGATEKERRAFLAAVGERLIAEAGPSQERKVEGLAGKHRFFDDPDGETARRFGTMLTMMARRR
jgi:hypothetical protein